MKKCLLTGVFLLVCLVGYTQSLSFDELKSLTNLNNDQAHNYLLLSKNFKSAGKKVYDSRDFELFKSNRTDPAIAETVSLRASEVTNGEITRQVSYFTLRFQDINALLTQARKSDLALTFKGSDQYRDIYYFDNSLFKATFFISLDKRSGSIQLEEK